MSSHSRFTRACRELGAIALWNPPAGATQAPDLIGELGLPDLALSGGAELGAGLIDGAASVELNGSTQYLDTGWTLRRNGHHDPLMTGYDWLLNNCTAEFSNTDIDPPGIGMGIAKFTLGSKSETARAYCNSPDSSGLSSVASAYLYAPVSGEFKIEILHENAKGEVLGSASKAVTLTADQWTRLEASKGAPEGTTRTFLMVYAVHKSEGEVVYVAGPMLGDSDAYFPTRPQLESGLAGWGGTENASESFIGPFARGTKRTYIVVADAESLTGNCLFGANLGDGRQLFRCGEDGAVEWYSGFSESSDAEWTNALAAGSGRHVIALGISDNKATLWVDGVNKGTSGELGSYGGSADSLKIGSDGTGEYPWDGGILPFAVFPSLLTDEEVAEVGEAIVEAPRLLVNERPPMRQHIVVTTPKGRSVRWGEDEYDGEAVIESLEDSDSVPGGEKELTASLGRRSGADYGDITRGSRIELFGAGNQRLGEYRLERAPQVAGEKLVVSPAASGYHAVLSDDESVREIFIDSDMGEWGEPSAAKRAANADTQYNVDGQVTLLPSGTPESEDPAAYSKVPAIAHAFARVDNEEATHPDVAESVYNAAGIKLGKILLSFATIKGLGGGWATEVWAANDTEYKERLHDFESVASETAELSVPAGISELALRTYYPAAIDGTGASEAQYRGTRILGRHELPIYGTYPEIGLLASDVIAYLLRQWAPSIRFTTGPKGTIRPTTFVLPQLAFTEPTTVQEAITKTLATEMLEWGVWGSPRGPEFHLTARGEREGRMRWRARVRPAHLEETGPQIDRVYNGVVVSWQDAGGETRIAGPPESSCPITSERLIDADPENPANELGIKRWKHLPLGVSEIPEPFEAAERFLAYSRERDGSGQATLTGYVESESGAMFPYYCVRAGDLIEFLDSSIKGYRYIVEASRSRQSRSVAIQLDQPPDSEQAMDERLNMALVSSGLAQ